MSISSVEPAASAAQPSPQPVPTLPWSPGGKDILRAEMYGLEALEARARELAAASRLAPRGRTAGPLLRRLARNERVLARAHRRIREAAGRGERLTPDAEWLLDNYYVIEEVLREVRHDLPRGYSRELPKLADGPLAGYPRIYALALVLIAHTDSSLDEDHITRYVQAYQAVAPLTIGELWAVPTMLRLGLVENLRRLAEQMLDAWDERTRAERWVTPLRDSAASPAESGSHRLLVLPSLAPPPETSDAFIVRALQYLRDEGPPVAFEYLKEELAARGINPTEVVRRANQHQAINQVSVGNAVTSLRLLGALDWGIFFERTNLVDPVLHQDPAGVYDAQDFATRDRYRQVVERLAKRSRFTEIEVARRAVEMARHAPGGAGGPAGHVGYYLVGPGAADLKVAVQYRPAPARRLLEAMLDHPHRAYFGSVAGVAGLLLALVGWAAALAAGPDAVAWAVPLLVAAALLPVSELAVGLVNYLVTLLLPPRVLPKLEFRDGIPADCATFVVMPAMLVRPGSAAALLERLEIHYLANPDPQLSFALLTDFADAPTEHRPEDEGYVRAALDGVEALNRRYAGDGPPRFFLFHRGRRWNPAQGCWMGWERKRGKLSEFNGLLRGRRGVSEQVCSTDPRELPHARYIITLDADTQLPRDAARRLVGTLAHPLNRAHFDPQRGLVVEGYGVLQPRVSLHLPAVMRSRFARLWAYSAGIDPYSTAVSDVYQDLFGVGSFTGKGIYDVDAFEAATGHSFPDNHILSHDLIEGNFARCGLVTDIELFDDFPSRYHAYARREHRWIRGDWQLLPWLAPHVPKDAVRKEEGGRRKEESDRSDSSFLLPPSSFRKNPLPLLERWKIIDNLRRSLVPPAVVLWLALGWTVSPLPWQITTGVAAAVLLLPLLLQVLGTAISAVHGATLTPVREFRKLGPITLGHVLCASAFVLNQAYLAVDAITRTLVRLFFTRRHLLEWETSAAAERRLGDSPRHFWLNMWSSVTVSAALGLTVAAVRPELLAPAGLFLVPWLSAPLLAFWVSRPLKAPGTPLTPEERRQLRRVARKTWGFFETFVGEEDHWLPPDNYQEEPRGQIAHRTSPTNQGLWLLATVAAHDFGYLAWGGLLGRLEQALDTFDKLERFRGHFLNWYDTQTLQPLQPTYVSTVDSGNLLGCLLALKQTMAEKARDPIIGPTLRDGVADTLGLAAEALGATSPPNGPDAAEAVRVLHGSIAALEALTREGPADLPAWHDWLHRAATGAETLRRWVRQLPQPAGDLGVWADRLAAQLGDALTGFTGLTPWIPLLDEPAADHCVAALESRNGDTAPRWQEVRRRLYGVFGLAEFEANREALLRQLDELASSAGLGGVDVAWLRRVGDAVRASSAGRMLERCRALAGRADALATAMDFGFLYRPDRHLFAIGFNVAAGRLDGSSYDLLASEARLASFLAVARGDAPRKHWFHLGRLVVQVGQRLCLVSWGGTMFEYLMPELLLRRYRGTLLAESCEAAVARQIEYARERGVPWGISESAFSSQYINLDYQYQAFGVPGLGLKRGLAQDLVVAPYATALAAMVRPHEALANFRRLAAEGADGRYGFYEAIDYTRSRLPEGKRSLVVRCYMAHHQGMSLLALDNALFGDPLVRRFHAEPVVRATDLLLQERVPEVVDPIQPPEQDAVPRAPGAEVPSVLSRRITTPFTAGPRTHLLSNGRYSVMVTNSGAGYSRCSGMDVTRWREDPTRDDTGQFCYVRDVTAGLLWSTGYQPVGRAADHYEVIFSADKAEIRRLDGTVSTHLEVTACPENCAELRRVTLTNHDNQTHELELTSYLEVVLDYHGADLAHPAFGKLFLETEWVPSHQALLCRRRPRSAGQEPIWAVHLCSGDGGSRPAEYETDRARFLGRGRTPATAAAVQPGAALSGTTGAVLDPALSLRRRVRLEPGASASVTFCTAVARARDEALALADHYRDPQAALRVFDLAWAHSQIELRHLRVSTEEAHLYQRLAAPLIYAGPALRAAPQVITANRLGQAALWRHGISGDRPILLAQIGEAEEVPLVRQLLVAHAYWRMKSLEVDLVILCEEATGYHQELYQEIREAVRASDAQALADRPGGVFILKADQVAPEDRTLLQAAARVVLVGRRGSLSAQVGRLEGAARPPVRPTRLRPAGAPPRTADPVRLPTGLAFFNGLGGFTPDGREYCILPYARPAVGPARLALPPAPWINVVANPACGFLVSESGLGYTWSGNSQTNRLTPWSNDPVSDPPGEAVYLRDDETGDLWTPTPRPLGADAPTLVGHGQGYTRFERRGRGLDQELLVFVPPDDSLKLVLLRLRNLGERPRSLSATFYAEWVLGTTRDQAPLNVRTEIDPEEGALFAHNPFSQDFGGQVAFADVDQRPRTLTADRTEFLGRNGSPASPAALARDELSGRAGPALDPCAALQVRIELAPGEEREVVFLLGSATDKEAARVLVRRYKEPGRARAAFEGVCRRWDEVLSAVQVRTPDPALDLLVNRWLPYQVLSCRVWGRSAFYQSGGAYGFRDQLQDVMALVHGAPDVARAQLLRAAAHQFLEGDVQHWWHPPTGRGVRTHITDDFLWLPLVACHYVATTGDAAVLDEVVPYLRAPRLRPDQEDDYGIPERAQESGTLYDHCVRALEHGQRFGAHGLPLMGTGDWNDGMNKVGAGGKGETVWGAWFLFSCLARFADVAQGRGDADRAAACRQQAERLRQAIEASAWDGAWYRRAYFDDGTPLGSAQNDECQIDSIAQSWAVISGAAEATRARQAMASVAERLVRRADRLILLFTPPFDHGKLEPGYIKGYVPGIRENGGQYTHAATWTVLAAALLGQGTLAGRWFDLINPVRHGATPDGVARYRVEPYVMAGDVYGAPPHTGRGGWTWYTGSASWMFRVAVEAMLGLHRRGDRLAIEPCIPAQWDAFELTYRYRSATYHLAVENHSAVERGVRRVTLDDQPCDAHNIPLLDDGRTHEVRVILG
jgi:cyclic beta-1,2-glucan synthetase